MSDSKYINTALDNGREHRVGADLYDWQFNNTYDIGTVVPDIKTFINQLYTHLLTSQEVLCGITRLYGDMSDFVRDVEVNEELGCGYYSYTVEIPVHNIDCFKSLKLKKMMYYYDENAKAGEPKWKTRPNIFTINDSCVMTDLFEKRVMFFIEGQYFQDLEFYADPHRFILILKLNKYLTLEKLNHFIARGAKWSLLMVPFSTTLEKTAPRNSLIVNKRLYYTKLESVSKARHTTRNLWFLTGRQTGRNEIVSISTVANLQTDDSGNLFFELPSKFANTLNGAEISINAIALPNIKGGLFLGTGRAFQIDLDPNPIPPNNIICWECTSNGAIVKYIHDVHVTMYYPNVYTIDNLPESKNVYVTWYYSDDEKSKFNDPLAQYIKWDLAYATNIINNNIPQSIRSYIPYESKYTEKHYLAYEIQATRRNEFTFKFETLKDIITDDTRRLEVLYRDNIENTKYKWHSNPKYVLDLSKWGNFLSRVRRDTSQEIKYSKAIDFGMECIYFVLEHEDDRTYPVAVYIDGLRCLRTWQASEGYRTFIYVPRAFITKNTIIEFEIMKTRDDKYTVKDIQMPAIHNSIELPDEFVDISPQNFMIALREETSYNESEGGVQYIYKVAPNYEMYWLIFGLTNYIDGVPEGYTSENESSADTTTVITAHKTVLLDEEGNALKASSGNFWEGGDYHYLLERGAEDSYMMAPNKEFPDYEDALQVRDLGYYGDARRRFYEYLPNGDDNLPVFITPITKYFAEKHVRLVNTDIHKTWKFVISKENRIIKLKDFRLEPSADKFRVYLDGRLLDAYTDYKMDANIVNDFYLGSPVNMAILKDFNTFGDVLVEYVPYRYQLLYRLDNVSNNNLQLREACIKRPFSMAYYDVYLNGEKLTEKDITVVTPSKIIINRELHEDVISFYERAHDPDIYDNDKYMRHAIVDAIAEGENKFRTHLLPNLYKDMGSQFDNTVAGCASCTTSCTTTCTQMCGTACDAHCSDSCSGSCTGSCMNSASSAACGGCSAGCSSTCYGCAGSCLGNCSGYNTSQTTGCAGCDTTCGTTCTDTCVGTAKGDTCAGCSSSCVGGVTANNSSRSIDNSGSGCHAACSASCTGTCARSCTGDCSGTATNVTGCSGCSTACVATCTGCSGTCQGTATGFVENTETCPSCVAECGTSCSTSCSKTCKIECVSTCTGCSGTCDNECTTLCLGTCFGGCTINCKNNCYSSNSSITTNVTCAGCYASCLGSCATSSASSVECDGCDITCFSVCSGFCTGSCYMLCRTNCGGSCHTDCTGSNLNTTSTNSISN